MTVISNKIDSINKKLIILQEKIEQLEIENASLKLELQKKEDITSSLGTKYKNEGNIVEEIEEVRSSLLRFEAEIETCKNIIEEVL